MGKASFLVLTGHDFRSSRKANVHFIAQEMAKRGRTRVFSVGFSLLSRLKKDPRLNLEAEANKVGSVGEVECFLWRTALHPFNFRLRPLRPVERYFFDWYVRLIPNVLRRWIAEANFIVIESGLSVLLFRKIKQINPKATVVYLASDDVSTINCSPHIAEELERTAKDYDGLRLPSKRLLQYFQAGIKAFYVPHGMDTGIAGIEAPDPYAGGLNAVSIGSMLFDPTFFEIAAALRPDITFHVIGAGRRADGLAAANIEVYGEMPFRDTIAYMRYADIGIAPYEGEKVSDYLTDTSMKLAQYDFLGLPAVCPAIVVGDHASRFGYVPGDAASIGRAMEQALAHGHFTSRTPLTWSEVTDRIIDPSAFPDTRI